MLFFVVFEAVSKYFLYKHYKIERGNVYIQNIY